MAKRRGKIRRGYGSSSGRRSAASYATIGVGLYALWSAGRAALLTYYLNEAGELDEEDNDFTVSRVFMSMLKHPLYVPSQADAGKMSKLLAAGG